MSLSTFTDYTCLSFQCPEHLSEILMAELAETGFESFQEKDHGFDAYIVKGQYNAEAVHDVVSRYRDQADISYEPKEVEMINWNEEWEKNYDPIVVDDKAIVRASFHQPDKDYKYDIVINPKMSFGTGHHHTTYLMLSKQMEIDHAGKSVLDIGSGTGILAIMAKLRGAAYVEAFDVGDWCVENSEENFALNNCRDIKVQQGTINDLTFSNTFDILLANINRNVLLVEIPHYANLLRNKESVLLVSGFFEEHIPDIIKIAEKGGLVVIDKQTRNDWALLTLAKG
ncbi:50S ribosomal protein L11 methyltransferase [Roseivirga sp. BDSF3-8]|uniref:50S ribosomal protein L11 methyltransferase n=1 Tax=Roseivirga sp. BDSF3-8 TaxID=3241598 RepID=UPI003531C10E